MQAQYAEQGKQLTSMPPNDNAFIGSLSQDDIIQIIFGVIATVLGTISVVLAWVGWKSRRARIRRKSSNAGMSPAPNLMVLHRGESDIYNSIIPGHIRDPSNCRTCECHGLD